MVNNPDKSSSSVAKEDTTKDYAIVLFILEGNAPGIILSTWIFDEGQQCRYPTVKTNEARDNLLKKKSEPQENWSSNLIKILNFYETFAEARAHLRKAEDTSNLSSDDEEQDSRHPRKRIARKRFLSMEEDDSDDEGHDSRHLRKRFARKRFISTDEESDDDKEVQQKRPQLVKNKLTCSEPELHPYPLPVTPKYSTPSQHFFIKSSCRPATATAAHCSSQENRTPPQRESLEFLASATPSASASCTECIKQKTFNAELREMLTNMCTILQRVEAKVDALELGRLPESIDEEDQPILVNLPAKNEEEFESVEKALKENARLKKKFVKRMASVGGRSSRGLINNMLKSIFTDSVAETYSLSGKAGNNQEKKAFISTEVFMIMSFVCKKIYQQETDCNIRVAVSDWLNQAKVRKTRREKNVLHEMS